MFPWELTHFASFRIISHAMGTDGYSHGSDHLKTCVDVDVSALKFLQRFPLLWFRKRTDATPKETQQSAFEEAEAGKRELATLIDIKVGQLKFATAKELKTQFHASKAGRVAAKPRKLG